ncbi:MAG: DUF2202 domain-containing protein [Bacteroidales bacterium]|nr:DUF2202 domain-containing protein [Bacteroidales bacterium]MDD3989412.1 DUF2202 domain-containing protein [Bacteroidales bacterium]MDD4638358.1 DUF2202 domain-containing protein [Bacteroidales bacterium]
MKKRITQKAALLLLLAPAIFSCTKEDFLDPAQLMMSGTPMEVIAVKSDGTTTFTLAGVTPVFDSTAQLNSDEIEFLYAVREDEKVARDLYNAFFEKFKLKAFENISKAEENHIRAVQLLMDYYEIEYPEMGEYGKFADPARQQLYDSLLIKGETALEAFKVMAQIEEHNIVSYLEVLEDVDNGNIKILIENLEKASENHFKATIRQITALGGKYTAQFMSQEQYSSIIAKGFEQGKRYRYLNKGQTTNSGNRMNGNGEKRGAVNAQGECTYTSNGSAPGGNSGQGQQGRGYRDGR